MTKAIIAVDVGGTFTDLALYRFDIERLFIHKLLTTPDHPTKAFIQGLVEIMEKAQIKPDEITRIIHGTTLITNALIERKGSPTGFITTEGFRDVAEIGNELRYNTFDLNIDRPEPIVERWARRTIRERIGTDGTVLVPLCSEQLIQEVNFLYKKGIRTFAIGFFNSFANDIHEKTAKEIIENEFPDAFVSISTELAPEIREYERFSTAIANAYVKPKAANYFEELSLTLKKIGINCPIYLVLSDGGLTPLSTGKEYPIQFIESGPAAGIVMAADLSEKIGEKSVVAFDMGGTTAKLALIEKGTPHRTYEFEAARIHRFQKGSGIPLKISTIELIEIGAGGGSIAWKDNLGLLKVGPESASSNPGPACYDLGGNHPTVTDADLVLGYLNPNFFLGGKMKLNYEKACIALKCLGNEMNMNYLDVALGIHNIINNNMASATRVHIAEKGLDPRDHTMIATGGAGPVHAYGIAKQLNISKVIFPAAAGVASAVGMLVSEPTREWVRSFRTQLEHLDWVEIDKILNELHIFAENFMEEMGETDYKVQISADMRYKGQGYELKVDSLKKLIEKRDEVSLRKAFETVYYQRFGRTFKQLSVEILTWRLRVTANQPKKQFRFLQGNGEKVYEKEKRLVYFSSKNPVEVPVYDRYVLPIGFKGKGPAIIEEAESTIVIGPDAIFRIDPELNIIMELSNNNFLQESFKNNRNKLV